ncbi:MAG: nitroreductase family protein [Desulfobacteraceae bacterium]|nr:nitroreductase family protein [Desulfobacteraceae bacterium]
MNSTLDVIANRKSIRSYEDQEIEKSVKDSIINATLRAPTAGNMMLYSVIEVTEQEVKDKLAVTCDNQPFIAKAPLVLVFFADYQRWYDYFKACDVKKVRKPEKGDLFISCCDALIAAQTAVIAAESLGVGSCYIGDIMEKYEIHKELFGLPEYVFPITMVCFGYPTDQQQNRPLTQRFDKEYICFKDKYKRHSKEDFQKMYEQRHTQIFGKREEIKGAVNVGQYMYQKKYTSDYAFELNRSVKLMLKAWSEE